MTLRRPILPLLLVLTIGACGGRNEAGSTDSEAALPTIEDGVQVVHIEAGDTGYEPAHIQLRPGVPARLVFTRTTESECLEQVQIPDFGIGVTDLPLNEPVAVSFTPEEGGTFTFACGMDMMRGTIVVRS